MKNNETLICGFSLMALTSSTISQEFKLSIEVTGINQISNDMYSFLVSNPDSYLDNCGNGQKTLVDNNSLTVNFKKVKGENYCVTIFHDVDGNGKMKRKIFCLPAEPYGFSNNPSTTFDPTKYKICPYPVASETSIIVKL